MKSIVPKSPIPLTGSHRRASTGRNSRFGLTFTALAALTGGTLFGACEMRIRSAVIDGSKDFLFTDVLPGTLGELLPDLAAALDP